MVANGAIGHAKFARHLFDIAAQSDKCLDKSQVFGRQTVKNCGLKFSNNLTFTSRAANAGDNHITLASGTFFNNFTHFSPFFHFRRHFIQKVSQKYKIFHNKRNLFFLITGLSKK